ncbi:hypothetical protein B0H19DRAFT_1081085 [Mycena capillaripes]|nr:hypothetical protein B0H19DRAFT_1081085 [Mycena capillaripes]
MFEQKNEPPRSRIPGVLVEKQAKRSLGVIKLAFSPSGPQSIRAQLWINLSLSVEIWSQASRTAQRFSSCTAVVSALNVIVNPKRAGGVLRPVCVEIEQQPTSGARTTSIGWNTSQERIAVSYRYPYTFLSTESEGPVCRATGTGETYTAHTKAQ